MKARILCLSLAALAVVAGQVQAVGPEAADGAARPSRDGWRFTVGTGALYAPTYEGDDDYRLSLLPNFRIAYGERFFASIQEGVGYRLINQDSWRAGPIMKLRFARDEDGSQTFAVTGDDTDDLLGLGDVDASVELGGFVEYDVGALTLGVEARQAVTGHEGFIVDLNATWSGRGQMRDAFVVWSVGPRVRFVDDNYNAAYFGVTPAQSLASGLGVYQADGGLHAYGVAASLILPLSQDGAWAAVLIGSFDRLEGDAASSPLVQERGDDTQGSIGFFISRQF